MSDCWLCCAADTAAYAVAVLFLVALIRSYVRGGFKAVVAQFVSALRAAVPGLNTLITVLIRREASDAAVKLMPSVDYDGAKTTISDRPAIPKKGVPYEELLERMEHLKTKDADADNGRLFAFVYTTDKDKHMRAVRKAQELFKDKYGLTDAALDGFLQQAYSIFSHENALNPTAFPSLRLFENETCSMIATMLHGDKNVVGNLTSGGTESILMTIKTYRDMARSLRPSITDPEIVSDECECVCACVCERESVSLLAYSSFCFFPLSNACAHKTIRLRTTGGTSDHPPCLPQRWGLLQRAHQDRSCG